MSTTASPMPQMQAPFLAVPRDRGDEACEVLSPVAFKIWYRIARLTHGWRDQDEQGAWKQREEALISYTDFMRSCGIKDHKSITKAIKELVAKGFARIITGLGLRGTRAYALIASTTGKNPIVTDEALSNITPLREKIPQNQGKKSRSTTGKNPPSTTCGAALEVASYEAIETIIETSIEIEDVMRTSSEVTQPTPSAMSHSQEEKGPPEADLWGNPPPKPSEPHKTPEQLLYDILREHGFQPATKSEDARTFRYLKELTHAKPDPVTPDELARIIPWCQQEWKTRDGRPLPITAQSISKNLRSIRDQMKAPSTSKKGTTHVGRHTGQWTGFGGKDADYIIQC